MINLFVKGDLLNAFELSKFDAIVHGCNCFHTMGAGIAGQISKRYPEAFLEDKKTDMGDWERLGKYTYAETVYGIIVNAYTQFKPGKENIDYLYDNIREVFQLINKDFAGKTIGIPCIGSGIAGGDWDAISKIISENTPDVNVIVYYFD